MLGKHIPMNSFKSYKRALSRILHPRRELLPQGRCGSPSIFLLLNVRSKHFRSGLSAAGQLRGLHNLDTCDPHLGPSHDYPEASSSRDFPSAECCSNFLDTHLEGWRRLDCGKSPALSLSDLPQGLAVLSLQASITTKPERVAPNVIL